MLPQISLRKSLQVKLSRDDVPGLVVGLPDTNLDAERFERKPLLLVGELSILPLRAHEPSALPHQLSRAVAGPVQQVEPLLELIRAPRPLT